MDGGCAVTAKAQQKEMADLVVSNKEFHQCLAFHQTSLKHPRSVTETQELLQPSSLWGHLPAVASLDQIQTGG